MRRKGFTLIELMIVVVIIGILAALAIPRFMAASKKSKISEAKLVCKQLYIAASAYYEENGQYPPTVNDLFDNVTVWKNIGVPVETPSGKARFQYNITGGGTGTFRAVAVAIGKSGTTAASSREQLDNSLGDVTDITVDNNGNITGGTF